MATPLDLLKHVDSYLDAAPRGCADHLDVGPLRAFISRAPWPFSIRPRPDADLGGPQAVTSEDVLRAAAVLEAARQDVSFEWVEELVPSLRGALTRCGYAVTSYPLLVRPLDVPVARTSSGTRLLAADSRDLVTALAVSDLGFAAPGTSVGEAGPADRDAMSLDRAVLAHVQGRIRDGSSVVVVHDDPADGITAVGWHQPIGADTELVGIATLPTHRRRGAAAAVVAELLGDARARGCTLALLSAGDDDVARVYERVGFGRIGHCGAAEPASTSPTP